MYHPPSLYGTFLTRDSPVTPDVRMAAIRLGSAGSEQLGRQTKRPLRSPFLSDWLSRARNRLREESAEEEVQ